MARGGAPCYLGTQIDRATAVQAERVRLLVRSRAPVGVTVYLCEKNLFTSVACRSARLKISAEKTVEYGKWRWIDARINGVEKDNESKSINRRSLRPLNLSIGNPPGGYEIAIAGIQLVGSKNEILWQDGGFDRGARSWLMTTDHYHPFHVENLYLHLWIEQGSIGLLFIFLVSSVAIGTLWQQQSKGSAPLIAFVLTMLIAGLVNSPIDTPEATFIWAAVIFAVLIPDSSSQRPPISSSSVPAHHFDQSPRRRRRAVAVPSRRRQPIR